MLKQYAIEIKWALIFTVASLAWMLFERLIGLHGKHIDQHAIYTNLFAVVAIAIYVLALNDKRKQVYGGRMSWREGFYSGVIITVIVAVLSPLVQWISSAVITPHYFDNAIAYAVESGNSTQHDAEAFFNLGNYILIGIIGAVVMGFVTSAIVAFFTRGPRG